MTKKAYEEGVIFILANTKSAIRVGSINEVGDKHASKVIPSDAIRMEQLTDLFDQSMAILG